MIKQLLPMIFVMSGCIHAGARNEEQPRGAPKNNLDNYKLKLSLPDNFDVGKETLFKLLVTLDGRLVEGLNLGHITTWSYRCNTHDKYMVGSDDTIILDSNGETEMKFVIDPNKTGDGSWKDCRIVAIVEMKYGDDERTVTVESDVFVVDAAACKPDTANDVFSITTQPTDTVIGRKVSLAITGAETVKLDVATCHGLSLVHWGTDKVRLLTSETDVQAAELDSIYIVASNGINSIPDGQSGCKIRFRTENVCLTSGIETAAFDVSADPSNSMSHKFIEAYEYGGRAILNASIGGVEATGGVKGKYFLAQNGHPAQNSERVFDNQIVGLDPKPTIRRRESIKEITFMLLEKADDEVLLIKARPEGCRNVRADIANERQAYRCLR
ncbi:MAG: hypothetical protein OYH77_01485 [Pseudomonadota bacterium]|nr:hypothetical protein [Pseudomonadota bacterium]